MRLKRGDNVIVLSEDRTGWIADKCKMATTRSDTRPRVWYRVPNPTAPGMPTEWYLKDSLRVVK